MDTLECAGSNETNGSGSSGRINPNSVVTESTFPDIPTGSPIKAKSVSFSKLQAGDFVLISGKQGCLIRRLHSIVHDNGNTRLVMVDGNGRQETVPFVRLLARVERLLVKDKWANPNPVNLFQRAGFRVSCWFHRDDSAA